jgi:hypothetical protein
MSSQNLPNAPCEASSQAPLTQALVESSPQSPGYSDSLAPLTAGSCFSDAGVASSRLPTVEPFGVRHRPGTGQKQYDFFASVTAVESGTRIALRSAALTLQTTPPPPKVRADAGESWGSTSATTPSLYQDRHCPTDATAAYDFVFTASAWCYPPVETSQEVPRSQSRLAHKVVVAPTIVIAVRCRVC